MINKISRLDYSEFVGFIKERNRPSGGIRTVHNVAINALIDNSKEILEIGCNTGFTCVNMSLLTGCKCVGVDINENSIEESKRYAKEQGVNNKVKFIKADARKLPFDDESFDIVWCSNVTSFIGDKREAVKEYLRNLRYGGTLVVIPIYYIKTPPKKLVKEVSKAIGIKINVWDKNFWINLFKKISLNQKMPLELYYSKDFIYLDRQDYIEDYSKEILKKDHFQSLNKKRKQKIKEKLKYFMELFNENLKYAGFSIFLFQKRKVEEEVELFLTKKNGN